MKKRGLAVVTGVLVLCLLLGVYIWLKNRNETQETASEATEENEDAEEVVAISKDDVSGFSFNIEDGQVTWVKEDENWILSGQEDFPVDESKVESKLVLLSSITSERTLDGIENLKDYGLEDPVNTITVEMKDGTTHKIVVGDKNPSTNHTYIYLNDEKNVIYTVEQNLGELFSGTIYDFSVSEEYPTVTASTIQKIEVEKKNQSYTVESDADSSTGWYVTDQKGNMKEADSTNVGTMQSTVAGLTYNGYYAYDCEDWETYGLDEPRMTVKIRYTEQAAEEEDGENTESDENKEDAEEMEIVEKNIVLYIGDLSEDGNYYIRLGDSSQVHGMAQSTIDSLMNGKAFDYWKLSVDGIAISELDHLDVTYDGETYILKRVVTEEAEEKDESESAEEAENNEEAIKSDESDESDDIDDTDISDDTDSEENVKTVTTYYVNDQEVESEDFLSFYRNSLSMVCQSRLEEYEKKQEAELVLTYYGTDGQKISVSYIPRDGSFYTMMDQEKNYGLVNKMNIKELINSLSELLNSMQD